MVMLPVTVVPFLAALAAWGMRRPPELVSPAPPVPLIVIEPLPVELTWPPSERKRPMFTPLPAMTPVPFDVPVRLMLAVPVASTVESCQISVPQALVPVLLFVPVMVMVFADVVTCDALLINTPMVAT